MLLMVHLLLIISITISFSPLGNLHFVLSMKTIHEIDHRSATRSLTVQVHTLDSFHEKTPLTRTDLVQLSIQSKTNGILTNSIPLKKKTFLENRAEIELLSIFLLHLIRIDIRTGNTCSLDEFHSNIDL